MLMLIIKWALNKLVSELWTSLTW